MDRQIKTAAPMVRCSQGHQPRLYQASASMRVDYYAECAVCGIRAPARSTADQAAKVWNHAQSKPAIESVTNIIPHAFTRKENHRVKQN